MNTETMPAGRRAQSGGMNTEDYARRTQGRRAAGMNTGTMRAGRRARGRRKRL